MRCKLVEYLNGEVLNEVTIVYYTVECMGIDGKACDGKYERSFMVK